MIDMMSYGRGEHQEAGLNHLGGWGEPPGRLG